jgi:hypothetical protein
MKTLFGLLARVGKLEQQYTEATRPTAADIAGVMDRAQLRARGGLAALLARVPRPPRDVEQEEKDQEILTRYEAGLAEPPVESGLRRLLFEARLEKLRTRRLEDQAGPGSEAP